jgi:hypothetical protein
LKKRRQKVAIEEDENDEDENDEERTPRKRGKQRVIYGKIGIFPRYLLIYLYSRC